MPTVTILERFNGPPDSGNGGYSAGAIAAAIGRNVSVRLLRPVPLREPLEIADGADGGFEVRHAGERIATAVETTFDVDVPAPPSYVEALGVSRHYAGFNDHPFPTCFVCGPERARGDGLCIFPGSVPGTGVLAAPWMPDASLDNGAGKVRSEFIWAALDCPGYFASVGWPAPALLGELAVHVDRLVHVEEPCVVIGWRILVEGRKYRAGTALFDADGERCAVGIATWIELKGARGAEGSPT